MSNSRNMKTIDNSNGRVLKGYRPETPPNVTHTEETTDYNGEIKYDATRNMFFFGSPLPIPVQGNNQLVNHSLSSKEDNTSIIYKIG